MMVLEGLSTVQITKAERHYLVEAREQLLVQVPQGSGKGLHLEPHPMPVLEQAHLGVLRDKLQGHEMLADRTTLSPDWVAELLEACLRSTYFSYGGDFYEQREGAAMGSPVSAAVTNLYME